MMFTTKSELVICACLQSDKDYFLWDMHWKNWTAILSSLEDWKYPYGLLSSVVDISFLNQPLYCYES